MAGRRRLPLVAVERVDTKNDLGDLLARRAGAMAIEGLKHPAESRSLLAGQARVGRDRTTMQGGEKAINRFEPIQPVHTERHDGRGWCDAIVDELEVLTIAEIEKNVGAAVQIQRDGSVYCRQRIDWG